MVGGFRQGLAFTLATLARSGIDVVGLEDPGPREHDVIAQRAGLEAVPVPVDAEGLDVAALRATQARAVLVTPAHQCPTGVALSPSRRRELVAWANEVDGVIFEDDYDAEFRYDRQAVGSLQGLDPERVFALGSVSKTIAPAIRIGWVLAPPRFLEALTEEKQLSSRGAPGLDQEALALLIESGRFDRHLRRVRDLYRARRDALAEEVAIVFGAGPSPGTCRGLPHRAPAPPRRRRGLRRGGGTIPGGPRHRPESLPAHTYALPTQHCSSPSATSPNTSSSAASTPSPRPSGAPRTPKVPLLTRPENRGGPRG